MPPQVLLSRRVAFKQHRGVPDGAGTEFPPPRSLAMYRMAAILTRIGSWTASPAAFLVVTLCAVLWVIFDRESFNMHGTATLATWLMTLFIQRAEHRDTQALHAKLDELLVVHGQARNELARIDEKEPEDVEQFRADMRKDQHI